MRSVVALIGTGVALMVSAASGAGLPEPVVPEGLGVNIHFTGAPARDLDMLAAGGFRFIRMDFVWSRVERRKGAYDFRPYDELTEALGERGIRILYILDYSNKLYETDRSVRTPEGRKAFARFAAAAAERYRGRGILWELWNEPNHHTFWTPKPSVEDYMKLAHEALPAIRRADPEAVIVAPATSGIPFDFIEGCLERGLLDLVDAVTVHPYRQSPPETAARDVLELRALMARYGPGRPDMPVISGEWGYSAAWSQYDRERQGLYLPRELLANMSIGIPVSIWYDWHDDGRDPKEPEHNFGTVTWDRRPKPAYEAMKRLVASLGGMRFVKRLDSRPEDHLLLFAASPDGGEKRVIAAWTTGEAHEAELFPGSRARLSGEVAYVPVPADAQSVVAEGSWTARARSAGIRAGVEAGGELSPEFTVRVRNGLGRRARVRLSAEPSAGIEGGFAGYRGDPAFSLGPGREREVRWSGRCLTRGHRASVTVSADIAGHRSRGRVEFVVVNPLRLGFAPYRGGAVAFIRHSPGEPFEGTLTAEVGDASASIRVRIGKAPGDADARSAEAPGEKLLTTVERGLVGVRIPLPWRAGDALRARATERGRAAADSGEVRIAPMAVKAEEARALNDGDPKVGAEFELLAQRYAETDAPAARGVALKYRYDAGWKFVRVAPKEPTPIEGKPRSVGVWVRGDPTGCAVRMRFRDSTGRTFQPHLGELTFSGWRFMTARMDDPGVGHWGGTGDEGRIAYPIRMDTFVLVDGTKRPVEGETHFAGYCLIYGP